MRGTVSSKTILPCLTSEPRALYTASRVVPAPTSWPDVRAGPPVRMILPLTEPPLRASDPPRGNRVPLFVSRTMRFVARPVDGVVAPPLSSPVLLSCRPEAAVAAVIARTSMKTRKSVDSMRKRKKNEKVSTD